MKRSLFIATIASLIVPAVSFGRKSKAKRNLKIKVDPTDIMVNGLLYSARIPFPYEYAVFTGPGYEEGTQINKSTVDGVLESTASFTTKLERIVVALDNFEGAH